MFGIFKDEHYAGAVERIGLVAKNESTQWFVLLLVGSKAPLILKSGFMNGEYNRVIEDLALTVPGDDVAIILSGTGLKSFTNRTLNARLGTTR
jgi:hypothetical protein